MIRRASDWTGTLSAADLTAIGNSTPDGFTGHEMLDGVGLIHMRGRVYDPAVGRFLSVDPIVRDVGASQSWNGYGYVEGRTLSWTDPSGYEAQLENITVTGQRDKCGTAGILCNVNVGIELRQLFANLPRGLIGGSTGLNGPAAAPAEEPADEGSSEDVEEPPEECYAPFTGEDSFLSSYAARVGNLFAGALDSFSVGLDLGAQISGSVNFFSVKPGFSAGMFNGNFSLTGAGNTTLSVKSPTPGRLTYGEASLSIGPVKVGTASASVTEGTSTRTGAFTQANEGLSGMAQATTWKSDVGKVGAHLQVGVGVKAEWDIGATIGAVGCALEP